MKTLINSIKCDLIKNITNIAFYIAVILGGILVFTFQVYEDSLGNVYNSITIVCNMSKEEMAKEYLFGEQIFMTTLRTCMPMYAMVISAFSYVVGLLSEKENKVTKYVIYRTGRTRYVLSKAIYSMISSGAVFGILTIIYAIYIHAFFPSMKSLPEEEYQMFWQFQSVGDNEKSLLLYELFGFKAEYFYGIAGMILYGCFCAAVGFLIYSMVQNIYFNLCIPFFVGYFQYSLVNIIMSMKPQLYVTKYGYGDYYLNFWHNQKYLWVNVLIFTGIWGIAIIANIIKYNRKYNLEG